MDNEMETGNNFDLKPGTPGVPFFRVLFCGLLSISAD